MSKDNSKRYKEILDLCIAANSIFASECVPHSVTFLLAMDGVDIGVHTNINRPGMKHSYYYDYNWNIPEGSVYDPRLDAAEAEIHHLMEKVMANIEREE